MTGDDGTDDAGPWVRLADAVACFIRDYGPGEGDTTLWRDLLLAVQARPGDFRLRISTPDGMVPDPTKSADITREQFAGVNWTTCHWVSGKPGDLRRFRFPLEVWRPDVVAFAEQRRVGMERQRRRRDRLQVTSGDDFEPLAVVLAPCFGKSLSELPAELQQIVGRHFLIHWDNLSPAQQRSTAQQWDIQHHPGLALERSALWKKSQEAADCERTASRIPLEERTMKDVKSQEKELRKLRKELAALEVELQQKAQILGLSLPDDGGDVRADPASPEAKATVAPPPPPAIPPGKSRARRAVGRPGVAKTCIELFKARRSRNIPLEPQIAEADAIVSEWPEDGPPKPRLETVSGHISEDYRQAKEAIAKTDKL